MRLKTLLIIAAVLGATGVIAGAFGAHALKEKLDVVSLGNWETATRYLFYHVIMIFIASLFTDSGGRKQMISAILFFLAGIILFSGSLYFISTRSLTGVSTQWLGPLTPLGGALLIGGWVRLLLGIIRSDKI
jgi:uncharacterized membrane protein YgdD (TMEM256/DUF423 family)